MIACPGVPGTFCLDDELCGHGKKCQAVAAKAATRLLYTTSDVVLGCRVEDGRLLVQLGNHLPPSFPLLFGTDERLVIETDGQAVTLRRERSK